MRMYEMLDENPIFKLYDGQLNKLFNLAHMTTKHNCAYIWFRRPQPKYNRMHYKMKLIKFIMKYILRLDMSHNYVCGTPDVARLVINQHDMMFSQLDQQISAAFLNMINVDIENAPSLKSTERILRHEYKFEECEKPWEAE